MSTTSRPPSSTPRRRDDPSAAAPSTSQPGPAARFDAFYDEAWLPLLMQTFAVYSDLTLARESVRHAFVDAWHHWARAERRGPEEYVRASAFAHAQWRGRLRVFNRGQRLPREHREVIRALQRLGLPARKAAALSCLSDVPVSDIGRQIGETERRGLALVDAATTGLAQTLGVREERVSERLDLLEVPARAAARPTAREIRGQGVRRRWLWLGGGIGSAVALSVGAGMLVHVAPAKAQVEQLPPALGPEVSAKQLLTAGGLSPLGKADAWTVASTTDNTRGDGINSFCQARRFADPTGFKAYVRVFDQPGPPSRHVAQTVELSRTEEASRAAYSTVLRWYGGCTTTHLQLLSTYDVAGLGDQAKVIKLRAQGQDLSSYAVAVARTGHVTTWTAVTTAGARNPDTDTLVRTLAQAVRRVCTSRAAGTCTDSPTVRENPPLPSGEQRGMLATADLPPVPGIAKPWMGTDAAPATINPAATTCDQTDFAGTGADPTLTRTYLIPGAGLPKRFGLSETVGEFPRARGARRLVQQVVTRMDTCEKRDPGAHITRTAEKAKGPRDSAWYLWRLESEISDQKKITYWMGVSRVGANVSQVTFVPGDGKQDLSMKAFQALLIRSRDRMFEISKRAAATSSPSAATSSGAPTPGSTSTTN